MPFSPFLPFLYLCCPRLLLYDRNIFGYLHVFPFLYSYGRNVFDAKSFRNVSYRVIRRPFEMLAQFVIRSASQYQRGFHIFYVRGIFEPFHLLPVGAVDEDYNIRQRQILQRVERISLRVEDAAPAVGHVYLSGIGHVTLSTTVAAGVFFDDAVHPNGTRIYTAKIIISEVLGLSLQLTYMM